MAQQPLTAETFGRATFERRQLPHFTAGQVDIPTTILETEEVMAQDTYWAEHSHPTHELLWNARGASTATIGPDVWTITPTVGLWIPAGLPHSGWMPAGTWYRAAQFSIRVAPRLADGPVSVDMTALLRLLLERLLTADLPRESRRITEAMVVDVVEPKPQLLRLPIPEHPVIDPIIQTMRHDPRDRTSLQAWAERLQVSSRTITRTFESVTGHTFSRWVATARIHHAVTLLTRDVELAEVAERSGYRSVSAFTAAFRRVTGATPGLFRAAPAAQPLSETSTPLSEFGDCATA